jgi:YVTN family beta-propeller protein
MRFITKKIFLFSFLLLSFLIIKSSVLSKTNISGLLLHPNPCGITINPITNIAFIANDKSNLVSIVDIETQTLLSTIRVGRVPRGVAIDKGLNIAVVGNSYDNTLSIVDMDNYQVSATIPVGKEPEGITIDSSSHNAYVANRKDNTVSVVDLMSHKVTNTIPVGKEPEDVTIDSELNLGLVVNKKDHNVSVIDLNTYQVIGAVQVGQEPWSIDINSETHLAAVANKKDSSITIIDLQTWSTNTLPLGKRPIDIAINQLDNRILVICDHDRRLLLVDPKTNTILKAYVLKKLPKGVAVNNFTNIAGVVDENTDSLTLFQLPNPVPEIVSITPNNIQRESSEITIYIDGNKFISSSIAYFNSLLLTTVFIDNKHIQATIPEEMLSKAGVYPVTITNPQPEGGLSNSMNFTVNNPIPSITVLDPAIVEAGTQNLVLNIYGTGFFNGTEIYFGGLRKLATHVNNTKLQIELTSEDLKAIGDYEIMAYNSAPGGGSSNKVMFTIKAPLEITITSPPNGAILNGSRTMVKGTIKAGTTDVGVKVNGIIAEIKGNEWIANNVPLTEGMNIIEAVATDSYGNTSVETITIQTDNVAQAVALSANIESGIAPLTTYFSVSTDIPNTIVSYHMDYEGDGTIDYTGTTFEDINHTYMSEGIYFPTLTTTDDQGNTFSDTIAVTVLSKTEIDTMLKGKWDKMKNYLVKQDIAKALNYYLDESKQLYEGIYTAFYDQLPQIAQEMQDIQLIYVKNNTAKYRLKENELYGGKTETITYYIYFVVDKDGLWKIYRY